MNDAPLLAARDLRIDFEGAIAIEGATFESHGSSLALVGDGYGILAAIAGKADVRSGELCLLGSNVERRAPIAKGTVGMAALDPPLPPRWTARDYIVWGARLAGSSRADARESAAAVLRELGLEAIAGTKLGALPLAERRALVLAEAVVTRPALLVASAPLSGLGGPEATYVARVLSAASRHRKWIVSLSNLYAGSAEHVLAASADDLLVFASGKLARQGKLRRIEEGTVGYTLMLRGKVAEFREALLARGVELSGGPQRFFVDLPPGLKTQDLLALSVEIGAPIVELVPRILLQPC
jgi:ABC-2 type transport system ATP-binding protein